MSKILMGERSTASDDNSIIKQTQATHAPDGRKVDVRPILQIIDDILLRATPTIDGVKHENIDGKEEKKTCLTARDHDLPEIVAKAIQKVSCELSCKCSSVGGAEAHATTMVLLNTLSSFSWDAKIVITLAAFAEIYGELGLVLQLYATNPLAKSVAQLKQLNEVLEDSSLVKPHFDALNKLITAIMDVSKCTVQLKELHSQYTLAESPEISTAMAQFPVAAYFIIRCAVSILISLGHEHMALASEARELSRLALQLNTIHESFTKQISYLDEQISFHELVSMFGASSLIRIDIIGCLKALIYAKDNEGPLFNVSTKTRIHLEVLKGKHVLLLISDLGISDEEIRNLAQIYNSRGKKDQYEILWIPICDSSITWDEKFLHEFEQLRLKMPWLAVHHPSVIKPAVIRFVKEVWHYQNKTILVTLSPEGKVLCPNALHMMWIWGNEAFPFNSEIQKTLWEKAEALRLELLVGGIDSTVLKWNKEGKIICLYGGEDLEWIQNFTPAAKKVAQAANIVLEIVYVGKSYTKDRVKKIIATISHEGLSHTWSEQTSISFWARLETMFYSKLQHGKTDKIMQEVMAMLSLKYSDQGWAIFLKGSTEMARAKGDIALASIIEYQKWISNVENTGFISALNEQFQAHHSTGHHCNSLTLPGNNGGIPQQVVLVCTDCGRPMKKYFTYRCCVD